MHRSNLHKVQVMSFSVAGSPPAYKLACMVIQQDLLGLLFTDFSNLAPFSSSSFNLFRFFLFHTPSMLVPLYSQCAGLSCPPDFVPAFPSLRVFLRALPSEGLPSLLDPAKHTLRVWVVGLFSVKRIYRLLSPWGALNEILPLTEKTLNKPQLVLLPGLFHKAVPSSLSE